jgi:hypothetical protein
MDNSCNCPICIDIIEKEIIFITTCEHIFHNECILSWLKSNNTCPLCRTILIKNNINTIKNSTSINSNSLVSPILYTYGYSYNYHLVMSGMGGAAFST